MTPRDIWREYLDEYDPPALGFETVATPQEFHQQLQYALDRSNLTAGQVVYRTGLPRSTVYSLLSPTSTTLPGNEETAQLLLAACGLSGHEFTQAMECWERLAEHRRARARQRLLDRIAGNHVPAETNTTGDPRADDAPEPPATAITARTEPGVAGEDDAPRPPGTRPRRLWLGVRGSVYFLIGVALYPIIWTILPVEAVASPATVTGARILGGLALSALVLVVVPWLGTQPTFTIATLAASAMTGAIGGLLVGHAVARPFPGLVTGLLLFVATPLWLQATSPFRTSTEPRSGRGIFVLITAAGTGSVSGALAALSAGPPTAIAALVLLTGGLTYMTLTVGSPTQAERN